MGQCVNSKHPEVVMMAGELNAHPAVVAAQIGIWQEKNNNYDRFPTSEELNKSKIQDDIALMFQNNEEFKNRLEYLFSKGATYNDYVEHRHISFLELGSKEDLDHFESKYRENLTFNNTKVDPITEQEYKSYSKIGSLEDFILYKQSPLYRGSRVKKSVKQRLPYFKEFVRHQNNNVESTLEKIYNKLPSLEELKGDVISERTDALFTDIVPEDIKSPSKSSHELLFGANENNLSIQDVITNLLNSSILENSEASNEIITKLSNIRGKLKLNIRYPKSNKEVEQFNSNTIMVYDNVNKTILVSPEIENYNSETIVSTLLHETVHAITVDSMMNPQSFEDKAFNDLINKSYEQFKHLSSKTKPDGSLSYGFKDVYEFVAEIYSNPDFRQEIRDLDKSWFSKFIDAVRRLLGLAKKQEFTDFVRSSVLFNAIDDKVNDGNQSFNSIIAQQYFANEDVSKQSLTKRLKDLISRQLDNVDQIARRANKKNDKSESALKFRADLKELQKNLSKAFDTDQLIGIAQYINFMEANVNTASSFYKNLESNVTLEDIRRLDSYIMASNLTSQVRDVLTDARLKENPEVYNNVKILLDRLDGFSGKQATLISSLRNLKIEVLKRELKKPYFASKAIMEFKNNLAKDYPKESTLTKTQWLNQEMIKRQPEVDAYVEKQIADVLEGVTKDIHMLDKALYSSIKTESSLIQLVQRIISKMKVEMDKLNMDSDFKIKEIFDEYVKTGSIDTDSLLETDAKGVKILKSEYPIEIYNYYRYVLPELKKKLYNYRNKLENDGIHETAILNDPAYKKLSREYREARSKYTKEVTKENGKTETIIDPKYKRSLDLKPHEQRLYNEFIKMYAESEEFNPTESLVVKAEDVRFFNLPYKTKTLVERVSKNDLNVKDYLQQKKSELFEWKIDEIDQYQAMYDNAGNKIYNIPIMFRNHTDPDSVEGQRAIKEQSTDLFTLLRAENFNKINYTVKSENEMILNTITDIAGSKNYIKTEGIGTSVRNVFSKYSNDVLFNGGSKTHKRIQEIVEQSLYNVFRENGFKILGADSNKIAQNLNKHTSMLGMTLNIYNAPVNVMSGEFQMLLSRIGKDVSGKSLREAHVEYSKDLPEIMKDLGRPVKLSKVNQLNMLLDMFGGLTQQQTEFIKNNIFKNVADPHSLQILQEGGEHMLHSVLAIALAKDIKVLNENGENINLNGKVISEKDGASLYDTLIKDKDGRYTFDTSKFKYTNLTMYSDFETEGLASIRLYVKNQIENMFGQYDINFANSLQRTWYGQLLMMYKKYLIPLGLARFKGGFTSAFGNLNQELSYNDALQGYDEGFYISTVKAFRKMFGLTMANGIKGILENMKLSLIKANYENLTDLEKRNLRKGVAEIGTIVLLTSVIVPMLAGLAGDDDDPKLWYLAMIARRLEQEISQYVDLTEAYNLTENPVASLNIIELYIDTVKFTASPWNWASQKKDGSYRAADLAEKLFVPSAWRHEKSAKQIFKQSVRNQFIPYNDSLFYQIFEE